MPLSFRDPAGHVLDDGEHIVRTVHQQARVELEELLASSLYKTLCADGWLIPAADSTPLPGGGLQLIHPRIEIPNYPFEWTGAMLADAARLTLDIQAKAHGEGWTLKDAAASNVLFDGSQPRFCDLLSLRRRRSDEIGWEAYGQFVRNFVLPMLVLGEHGRSPREVFLAQRDGLRAADVASHLPWRRHWGLASWLHIRWPARLEARRIARPQSAQRKPRASGADAVPWLLNNLRHYVDRLEAHSSGRTAWSSYTENRDHYLAAELRAKREAVQALLNSQQFTRVLDIGANSGEFSLMAAQSGAEVVSIDDDLNALDQLHGVARSKRLNVQCLHVNLARPTPPTGWRLDETLPLPQRLTGRFDLVLMLAVIHHLGVTERLPLNQLLGEVASYCTDTCFVEFVPHDDPRFVEIAGSNADLYQGWSLSGLLEASQPWFVLRDQIPISRHRTLLRLQRR